MFSSFPCVFSAVLDAVPAVCAGFLSLHSIPEPAPWQGGSSGNRSILPSPPPQDLGFCCSSSLNFPCLPGKGQGWSQGRRGEFPLSLGAGAGLALKTQGGGHTQKLFHENFLCELTGPIED